jgi:hypothetical protein
MVSYFSTQPAANTNSLTASLIKLDNPQEFLLKGINFQSRLICEIDGESEAKKATVLDTSVSQKFTYGLSYDKKRSPVNPTPRDYILKSILLFSNRTKNILNLTSSFFNHIF